MVDETSSPPTTNGGRGAAVVDAPPLRPYASVREVSAPFSAGQRFRSLPAVRVWTDRGWVNRVGSAVPEQDEPLDAYVARMRAAGRERFAVDVLQPWVDDPARWSWLRDEAWRLWQVEGFPVLPVQVELVLAHESTPPPAAVGVETWWTWLLKGRARVATGGRAGDELTPGSPVRHAPDAPVEPVPGSGPATWVTVRVATDPRKPVAFVAEMLATEMTAAAGPAPVPHIPWELRGEVIDVFSDAARQVRSRSQDTSRTRQLALAWVRRVSAAALEPAPRPRSFDSGGPGVGPHRRTAPVVHLRHGDEILVAANGHGFAVSAAAGDLVREMTLADVVDPAPAGSARAALVTRLWQLRAVEELS